MFSTNETKGCELAKAKVKTASLPSESLSIQLAFQAFPSSPSLPNPKTITSLCFGYTHL